jgi:hypothetical protein
MLPDLQETIDRAKAEVRHDIECGTVPLSVKSFSDLHSYVDANYYGGAFGIPFDESDATLAFWNAV